MSRIKWAYGITTVPERAELLTQTLESLRKAGFDNPTLFVDGPTPLILQNYYLKNLYVHPVIRSIKVGALGNWLLSLWELYLRNPSANRYAIFQDDFITYADLKIYLTTLELKPKTYWNLYTMPSNQELADKGKIGFYPSNQFGRSAVALVFDNEGVKTLLSDCYEFVQRACSVKNPQKGIDGRIIETLKKHGYTELVHNPSLTQHTGLKSSLGNNEQPLSLSFITTLSSALELLK